LKTQTKDPCTTLTRDSLKVLPEFNYAK
jgi:hypothetical protein